MNEGATDNSHTGQCAHTAGSADVETQNFEHRK
jgi:hypothetical protein